MIPHLRRGVYGRGTGRNKRDGSMGPAERKFALDLADRKNRGEIVEWAFEPERLRLADKTYYVPDFRVLMPDGEVRFYEVKPRTMKKLARAGGEERVETYFADGHAKTKVKVAAEQHPYRFFIVYQRKVSDGGTFVEEEV